MSCIFILTKRDMIVSQVSCLLWGTRLCNAIRVPVDTVLGYLLPHASLTDAHSARKAWHVWGEAAPTFAKGMKRPPNALSVHMTSTLGPDLPSASATS